MKNNTGIGSFEVSTIPGITLEVLRGIGFTQEKGKMILYLDDATTGLIHRLSDFGGMEEYIDRRIREYIAGKVFAILIGEKINIRVTSIKQDLSDGYDLKIRQKNKSVPLRYCDVTESSTQYRRKIERIKQQRRDQKMILYTPRSIVDYCMRRLENSNYTGEEIDKTIKNILMEYGKNSAEKLMIFNDSPLKEYELPINE